MPRKTIVEFKGMASRGTKGLVTIYKSRFDEYIFWLMFFDIFEEHQPCWN